MQIILTPNDIIQRCLWDKYKMFCLGTKTEEEIKEYVIKNDPIPISENDAYAIGLLKIIETNNLVHRFNENILDVLQIKSNIIKDELYISKSILTKEINQYYDRFPDYYNPPFNYKQSLVELKRYIEEIKNKIDNIDIVNVKQKEKIYVYYKSRDIRKCLVM